MSPQPYRVPADGHPPKRRPPIRWATVLRHPFHGRTEAPIIFGVSATIVAIAVLPLCHWILFGHRFRCPCYGPLGATAWITLSTVGTFALAVPITMLVAAWRVRVDPTISDESWRSE